MEKPKLEDVMINPFYALNISPALSEKHEPMVSKETWVKSNVRLMDQMGKEEWLNRLLRILETGEQPHGENN
jgi:hypothetical protein